MEVDMERPPQFPTGASDYNRAKDLTLLSAGIAVSAVLGGELGEGFHGRVPGFPNIVSVRGLGLDQSLDVDAEALLDALRLLLVE